MKAFSTKTLQVLNWVFYLMMVAGNYLAVALPFNNKTTKQLSDQYPNLFVPAPITFSIWGVIYLLLFIFLIKQSKSLFRTETDDTTEELVQNIGGRFILTCLLNVLWMLTWHYEYMAVSVVVMLTLLSQLVVLNRIINLITPSLSTGSKMTLKSSFGLYLGWICVATVANITAALVSIGWTGFGKGEVFWASTMIVVAALIVAWALNKLKNGYIALAVLWAFTGILIARHDAAVYHRFVVWSAVLGQVVVGIALILELIRSAFRPATIKPTVI